MFFQILLAIFVGVCFGIVTGLCPGIHINLVSVLIFSVSLIFLQYTSPLILTIVIISMAVTHTFLDTIPSIFLGAPDADTVLSVLPGHRLLLEGKGYEAVMLTVVGSLSSLIICVCLAPLMIPFVSIGYPIIKSYIGYALLCVSFFLIWREGDSRVWALIIFLMSGLLGVGVLNMPNLKEPLFPLLSGLFGTSMLFLSYNNNVKIPKQEITKIKLKKGVGLKAVVSSVFAGSICSFMPGLGPSQAAILGSQFTKKLGNKGFLTLVGGVSTVNMIMSFITLYTIQKTRNGAIVVVSKILENFNLNHLTLFLGCALVVAGIATFLAFNLSKIFSKMVSKLNYKLLCLTILILITTLVIILSGFLGLLVLTVATFVGMIPALKGVGRNHMMGSLLLPVILYFLLP